MTKSFEEFLEKDSYSSPSDKETRGAWIVHHGRKLTMDVSGPAEFSVLDEAGKAAELLMRLGATNQSTLNQQQVGAVAKSINLNVRTELPHYLNLLKNRRVIDLSQNEVNVLGVTTRLVLGHAVDIFRDANPSDTEIAAVELSELVSKSPVRYIDANEYIGDNFGLDSGSSTDFIRRASEIGFVDIEGDSNENRLLFNGNLFRRESVEKAGKVLNSLSSNEQSRLREFNEKIGAQGCIHSSMCINMLGDSLYGKLHASGMLEVSVVSNENGDHSFVTLPGAFHKFVNPMIDDSFDMAKSLVSALSYGMYKRHPSEGKIHSVDLLLKKLINGMPIGPATAIGADYRVLEQNRVVKIVRTRLGMYEMILLKREIGQLALQVLKTGDGNFESISLPPDVPMSGYSGPERSRERFRKKQSKPSRRHTYDLVAAVRGDRGI